MRKMCFLALLAVSLMPSAALAQTEIHKCTDADGGVMYSQLPCKDEVTAKVDLPAESEVTMVPPHTVGAAEPLPPETLDDKPGTSESRVACKKRYRDEIDAIDAEIRREYTKEKDGDYKQRLLALTRKLREC